VEWRDLAFLRVKVISQLSGGAPKPWLDCVLYAFFLPDLHGYFTTLPQHSVLAINGRTGLIELSGGNLSPRELQGRYSIALQTVGSDDVGARNKPIYQRNSRMTEQQAIEEAAQALRVLWKVRKPARP
jgi:hypothetical protein